MFITRECDYAARVLRALSGETRLSVNEICEKESITAPFAYKILKKLQKAGIVKGYRGVHGGYAMNKSLGELTLFDVYKAIDPDLFIIECMASGMSVQQMEKEIIFLATCTENSVRFSRGCGKCLRENPFRKFSCRKCNMLKSWSDSIKEYLAGFFYAYW